MSRNGSIVIALTALGTQFVSIPALARDESKPPSLASAEVVAAQQAAGARQRRIVEARAAGGPETFGTDCCQVLQIPAAAFTPISGAVTTNEVSLFYDPYVWVESFGGSAFDIWAPVTLPTGAFVSFLDLFYSDSNASEDMAAVLARFHGGGPGSGPPDEEPLATVMSVGASGAGYATVGLAHTVRNNVAFHPDAGQYVVLVTFPDTDGSIRFKGVDLWWQRQVSPAPAVATFGDVPTSHPQFSFVEALAESGITVGCGSGNFCPTSPLTRGQMAVFLAKALGLYWPY